MDALSLSRFQTTNQNKMFHQRNDCCLHRARCCVCLGIFAKFIVMFITQSMYSIISFVALSVLSGLKGRERCLDGGCRGPHRDLGLRRRRRRRLVVVFIVVSCCRLCLGWFASLVVVAILLQHGRWVNGVFDGIERTTQTILDISDPP